MISKNHKKIIDNIQAAVITGLIRKNQYRPQDNVYLATELVGPPLIRLLKLHRWDDIVLNASGFLWSLRGTMMHKALQEAAPENALADEKLVVSGTWGLCSISATALTANGWCHTLKARQPSKRVGRVRYNYQNHISSITRLTLSKLQPNSRHCFACGLENPIGLHLRFYYSAPGEVRAELTVPDQYQGYPGVVHGGIVSAMLDEAAGRSQMGHDPAVEYNPRFMFTARLDIRYRQNVPVGQPLRAIGKAGRSKGRTAEAQAFLYDAGGHLLAEATALLVDVPDGTLDTTNLAARLQSLAQRVFSENHLDGEVRKALLRRLYLHVPVEGSS